MKMDLIPFYTENIQDGQNYTLLFDEKKNQVYKAYHRKVNQIIYLGAFVLTLALVRGIENIFLPINGLVSILLLIFLGIAGIAIGVYCYKKIAYQDIKEIFLTQSMIEEKIQQGKTTLRIEVWTTSITLLCFVVFSILFIISNWLVWLLVTFYLFILAIVLLSRLPIRRFKLIKKGVIK